MPLKFERTAWNNERFRIHYQDEFGQPRFFEFTCEQAPLEVFCKELIQQVNELLARPRPAETNCRIRLQNHGEDVEYIDGQAVIR